MIENVKFTIRDEERWLTGIQLNYQIDFNKDVDLDKIVELHQQVSEKLGSDKSLPVLGGLFHIVFSSTYHDDFFYDWLFEGVMQDGHVEFVRNEVETIGRIDFWDCYCVSLEERMSANGAPMEMELCLSPAIVKKDGFLYEKIWKVTDIHGNEEEVKAVEESKEKKVPEITAVYWKDAKGEMTIEEIPEKELVTLYAETKNVDDGETVRFEILYMQDTPPIVVEGNVLNNVVIVENFSLRTYREKRTMEGQR